MSDIRFPQDMATDTLTGVEKIMVANDNTSAPMVVTVDDLRDFSNSQIKNADQIVTDAGFTITWEPGDIYAFPQYKGVRTLVNKEDTSDNGYYKFIEEIDGVWYYERITPTPTFLTVSNDLTFGQGVFYPELMSVNGTPRRWKQITDGGYTPPAPSSSIELTFENPTYTITDDTPDVLGITSNGGYYEVTGYGTVLLTNNGVNLTADKTVVVIIGNSSEPVSFYNVDTQEQVEYESGRTVFLFYRLSQGSWTISDTSDPVIPDIKDLFVSKKTDDFVFFDTETGYAIEYTVVGETYVTDTDLGMADGSLLFLYQSNVETDVYNQIGIYQYIGSEEVVEGFFRYYYRCLILGQDLNIVRVANDKVYHNQYNGTNLSTLEFREIQEKLSEELLENISNIPTIDPVDGDEYSFMTEKGTYKTISIQTLTLELEDWDSNLQQTKTIAGIADKIIEMTAVAESTSLNFTEAAACQLRILEDLSTGDDLVFQVENLPEIDLTVKIKIS
jgi:hypothetical protein